MRMLWLICILLFGGAAAVTVFAEDSAFDELSQAVKKKTVERLASAKPADAAKEKKVDCSVCKPADCPAECKTETSKH